MTCALLWVMQLLIATGEEIIIEPLANFDVSWIQIKKKEVIDVEPVRPIRPEPPVIPPRPRSNGTSDDVVIGVEFPVPPAPQPVGVLLSRGNFGDGPLVSIIVVKPQYPLAATKRGLEGTVLVQFDVTAEGAVANVEVVESSNSIFDNAAVSAAYRFKFKPKIVDGIPYETRGLRNLFRFEMEK